MMNLKVSGRTKTIFWGTITTVIPRGLGFLYTIIIIPLVLNLLGKEALGVWLTVISIIELLNFADFGITNNIINKISETSLNNENQKEKEIISSSFFAIVLIALIIICLYMVIKPHLAWANILGINNQKLMREALVSLNILIGYFIINFPLVIFQKIRYAIQERHYLNYYEGFGKAVSIVLVLVGVYLEFRLPSLILMFITGPIIGQILNTFSLLYRNPHYLPSVSNVNRKAISEVFSTSQYFFLINICYLFYTSLDNLLISSLLNAGEVAKYATVSRVYLVFPMLIALATPSIWVANREAYIKKDFVWIKSLYSKVKNVSIYSILLLIGASFILNSSFFTWFTNKSIEYDQFFIVIVSLNAATIIFYNLISSFFIAVDEIKVFTVLFATFSVVSFLAKYNLLEGQGLTLAYGINFIIFVVLFSVPCILYLNRKLKRLC